MRALLALTCALAVAAFAAPPSRSLDDPTIVAIFDAANTFDIETGELALKRSHTPAVRDLATQFMHDHAAVRQQGRELAAQLKVTPTPPAEFALADAHKQALAELKTKSGAEFDMAYIEHEIAFHQAVLDAVSGTLLPAIQNPQLKAFVQKVGPAFLGHLEAAKQLQRKIGSDHPAAAGA